MDRAKINQKYNWKLNINWFYPSQKYLKTIFWRWFFWASWIFQEIWQKPIMGFRLSFNAKSVTRSGSFNLWNLLQQLVHEKKQKHWWFVLVISTCVAYHSPKCPNKAKYDVEYICVRSYDTWIEFEKPTQYIGPCFWFLSHHWHCNPVCASVVVQAVL